MLLNSRFFISAAVIAATLGPLSVQSDALADEAEALAVLSALHEEDVLTRDIVSDSADRIRLVQRLTMLSQRVAAASCALTSGVAPEESFYHLEEAMWEVDLIIDALRNGNDVLHVLGVETDRKILADLDAFEVEWQSIHGAIEAVLADGHDADSAHIIDDHNMAILELATALSTDIASEYTFPYELTQRDAMLIGLASRQRMLTQKMSKDACEIWTGYHAEEGRADLIETMANFENSLIALQQGLPAMGIIPAPTPEIAADLDSLLARWNILRGNLDTLVAGGDLNMEQKIEIFHDFNVELDELDHLVDDYKDYAQRTHS